MDFSEIIKTGENEGKEKHVPTIMIDKGHKEGTDIVRVVVGHEVPHPNTAGHHIAWIELYGVKMDGGENRSFTLGARRGRLSTQTRMFASRLTRSPISRRSMPWPTAMSTGFGAVR